MSVITKIRFVLAVLDLKRSTDYYTSVLGLTIDFEVPGWSFSVSRQFSRHVG